jgi:hypothetical protein
MPAAGDLGTLTFGDFEPHRGGRFELDTANGGLELRLAEATPSGQGKRPGGAFSLIFVAPAGPLLPQAIYPVTHPALGTIELFLVPIGPMHGGNAYQAVFA